MNWCQVSDVLAWLGWIASTATAGRLDRRGHSMQCSPRQKAAWTHSLAKSLWGDRVDHREHWIICLQKKRCSAHLMAPMLTEDRVKWTEGYSLKKGHSGAVATMWLSWRTWLHSMTDTKLCFDRNLVFSRGVLLEVKGGCTASEDSQETQCSPVGSKLTLQTEKKPFMKE